MSALKRWRQATMLREWRAGLGWTQPFAAARLGVGLRTYKAWELGECEPDHPLMLLLAMAALDHRLKAWEAGGG